MTEPTEAPTARLRLHHIGIVVKDLDEAAARYRALGFIDGERYSIPEQAIEAIVFRSGEGGWVELISPTDPEGPIARYMAKYGEGSHHIAYEVDDIASELERLKAEGVRLIDESPRQGTHGWTIAFIHPESTHGVLTELVQVEGLASP